MSGLARLQQGTYAVIKSSSIIQSLTLVLLVLLTSKALEVSIKSQPGTNLIHINMTKGWNECEVHFLQLQGRVEMNLSHHEIM